MARGDNFYSGLVAWMKIILPLVALGLLSILFLISRKVDPTRQPIVEINLEQRAREQGATRPSFAGVTQGGDEVTILAARARPDLEDPRHIFAEDISAELRLSRGTMIEITAQNAEMNQGDLTASLDGDVIFRADNGYEVRTERLNTRLDVLYADTPGPVQGFGPPGEITAGRMLLTSDKESGEAEILFTAGVKLIYTPGNTKE